MIIRYKTYVFNIPKILSKEEYQNTKKLISKTGYSPFEISIVKSYYNEFKIASLFYMSGPVFGLGILLEAPILSAMFIIWVVLFFMSFSILFSSAAYVGFLTLKKKYYQELFLNIKNSIDYEDFLKKIEVQNIRYRVR